jgi:prepilin-type N-terminal cleavage/methylation domain-containing protein
MKTGFTLIELLLVIGIVSILSVVVVLVINPANILKELRDSQRLSDLSTLTRALSIAETESSIAGTSMTIYNSWPDPTATSTAGTNCGYAGAIPSGYTYHCPASSTLTKVDGTGWLPANFTGLTLKPPLARLPIDPSNSTSSYYSFALADGDWTIYAVLESLKYQDKAQTDGGVSSCIYEQGRVLQPNVLANYVGLWAMIEGSGQVVKNCASNTNHATLGASSASGSDDPIWATSGSKKYLAFDGGDHVRIDNSSNLGEGTALTVSTWVWFLSPVIASAAVTKNQSGALQWSVWHDSSNRFRFALENISGSANEAVSDLNNFSAGVWYNVVGVYNGSSVDLYINGVDADSTNNALSGTIQNESHPIILGGDWGGAGASPSWIGGIYDVRIFSTALTATQILDIYNNGI